MNRRLLTFLIFLIMVIIAMLPSTLRAQIGGYAQVGSETFYNQNIYLSVGAKYKEVNLGVFYQQAKYRVYDNDVALFTRKGIVANVGIGNVDQVAYLSIGVRVMTANDKFVEVKPHGSLSFRFGDHFEIPITISTYEKVLTGIIGVRLLL